MPYRNKYRKASYSPEISREVDFGRRDVSLQQSRLIVGFCYRVFGYHYLPCLLRIRRAIDLQALTSQLAAI
jgi:hypothetical protein